MNWNPFLWRRKPTAKAEPPRAGANIKAAALEGARLAVARRATGRISQDDYTLMGSLARHEDKFEGFPSDSARRLCRVLRWLGEYDEDMHGALRDLIILANPGHSLEFVGGTRAVAQAGREIERWAKTIYPEGGSLDGLANNQIGEVYKSRASSCEWYPLKNRRGVHGVAVVESEYIEIRRNLETQAWEYWQTGRGVQDIGLHPMTYRYTALELAGSSPYGIPLAISAIESLDRKHNSLLAAETRILNLMKRGAFLLAGVPEPKPEELGLQAGTPSNSSEYASRLLEFYSQVADLMLSGQENGFYLHPSDVEASLTPLAKAADGMPELHAGNYRRVFGGIRSLGMLRGLHDATTETLARVIYPILEAEARNIQAVLKTQLEFGINLHLRLVGIPAVCWVHFDEPKSPFALEYAKTEKEKAETDKVLKELFGQAWTPHMSRRWDVDLVSDAAVGREMEQDAGLELGAPEPEPDDQNARLKLVYSKHSSRYQMAKKGAT